MRLKDQLQKRPVAGAIAIACFFILQSIITILFDEMLGPVKCRDGYASSAIGRSGACSSHGGVDRSRDTLIALLSVAGAGAIFIWRTYRPGTATCYRLRDVASRFAEETQRRNARGLM